MSFIVTIFLTSRPPISYRRFFLSTGATREKNMKGQKMKKYIAMALLSLLGYKLVVQNAGPAQYAGKLEILNVSGHRFWLCADNQ
jgi:hypothetical protein